LPQTQADPFDYGLSDHESLDADPIEHGIQITVKYDGKMLFSNTRWFERLDRHVYDKVLKIETDEVDRASTAKGRTKHRDGPWRVTIGIKKTNKTSTVADIGDWIDLLKVLNPLLVKKSDTVMKVECSWSRVEPTSPSSSPVKRTTKRVRTNTIDDNEVPASTIDLTIDAVSPVAVLGRSKPRVSLSLTYISLILIDS
jgi:hypothetical protein